MYLKLNGSRVLEMLDKNENGCVYTSKELLPPPLKDEERAYIYYDIDIDEFYFLNKQGEVI